MNSCLDENFTSSPDKRLTFSADTLRFDTIISTVSSSTRKIMIYNTNNEGIRVSNVTLVNGDNSGFRINLDGVKGTSFENVEVLKKDSMFLFVDIKTETSGSDFPERREDIIRFDYNGVSQQIILEAYTQDAYFWKGKVIEADTSIVSQKPIVVYDSLYIASVATLKLGAGTRFFLHDKANVIVDGTIIANGEINNPVVFRGDRTDKLFSNLAYDDMSAQWGDVIFRSESFGNLFNYTEVRGMTNGIVIDSTSCDIKKIDISNSRIRNSAGDLFSSENAYIEVYNSEFANSGGSLINIIGGSARFTHCTLANYYSLGVISGYAVSFTNYKFSESGSKAPVALIKADFNNCIIAGKKRTEVSMVSLENNGEFNADSFNFRFDHCYIKASGSDDDEFINTVWNEDPLFLETGDDYKFDFRLGDDSPLRGKGNPVYAREFPFDINGNARPAGTPDIGVYQWQENQSK